MAIMSHISPVPWIDPNGDPYSGAKAYFFDAGTTTPRIVYTDPDLSVAHDHPVLANGNGSFPAIFLPEGDYRMRITTGSGVVLSDIDGISTPTVNDDSGGGGGDTDPTLLFQTGDYIYSHRTGVKSGWVRAAGRTIGAAASGATERANADCEALFSLLWNQDATLVVSGGRGDNAASDWAANKTITLPDWRLRLMMGMASMGNTASTLIDPETFDNDEDGDTLGATVGAATVALDDAAQLPPHSHTGVTANAGSHKHNVDTINDAGSGDNSYVLRTTGSGHSDRETSSAGTHAHNLNIDDTGESAPHANVQPSGVVTCYLKL